MRYDNQDALEDTSRTNTGDGPLYNKSQSAYLVLGDEPITCDAYTKNEG